MSNPVVPIIPPVALVFSSIMKVHGSLTSFDLIFHVAYVEILALKLHCCIIINEIWISVLVFKVMFVAINLHLFVLLDILFHIVAIKEVLNLFPCVFKDFFKLEHQILWREKI